MNYDCIVQQIGHYSLIETLGSGAAGIVYKAQDQRQGRIVALKHIRINQEKARRQFERELIVSQQLKHKNIVPILDHDCLKDGSFIIIMPFFEGKTLEKLLLPLSFQTALKIALSVAETLGHAHEHGIIHCDIKPANILMHGDEVKVLDFGLAQSQEDRFQSSQVGTLAYLSPEAARGQKLSPASDFWSLAVILYELLTGQSPFEAQTSAAVLKNIAKLKPAPLTHLFPFLNEDDQQIFDKLLCKKPEFRYQEARALSADLKRLQSVEQRSQFSRSFDSGQTVAPKNADKKNLKLVLGREDELALLQLYLKDPDCRLLTLQGMGGIGKTHLSLYLAKEANSLKYVFENSFFIELVSVNEAGFVAAIARGLGLEGDAQLATLVSAVAERNILLILDNFEHLSSLSFLLKELLEACPNLKILVTSRERLDLAEEWVVPLQGLAFPRVLPGLAEARNFASMVLFERYARLHNASFDLSTHLERVFLLCFRLQGHPLGISLAAAMVNRDFDELANKLERFDQLASGEGRHRSLRAVFEQSYAQLKPEQQELLSALAVFESGFDYEAAHDIVAATAQGLDELLDHSLLERNLEARYLQHPIILSFCKEKLAESGKSYKERFVLYYLAELRALRLELNGNQQNLVLTRLERDLANFCVALLGYGQDLWAEHAEPLRVFYTHKGRYNEGLELFAKLQGFYARACHAWFALMLGQKERAEELSQGLSQSTDLPTQLLSLNTAAGLALQNNHLPEAHDLSLKALSLAEALDNLPMMLACTSNLALLKELSGQFADAQSFYKRSLELSEKSNNLAQTILNLNNLAVVHLTQKAFSEAKTLISRALYLSEKYSLKRMKPYLQVNFGLCLYAEKEYALALEAYQEALEGFWSRGDKKETVEVHAYMGQAMATRKDYDKAKDFFQKSLTIAQEFNHTSGMLCAIIRFAEMLAHTQADFAKDLASLVLNHPLSDPDDRNLAELLAQNQASSLNLDTATSSLMRL